MLLRVQQNNAVALPHREPKDGVAVPGSSMPSQDFRPTCSCQLICILGLTGTMTWTWVGQASTMLCTALEETLSCNLSCNILALSVLGEKSNKLCSSLIMG